MAFGFLVALRDEGGNVDVEERVDPHHRIRVDEGQLDGAARQFAPDRIVAAKLASGEDLHLDAALAAFLGQFRETERRLSDRALLGEDMGSGGGFRRSEGQGLVRRSSRRTA